MTYIIILIAVLGLSPFVLRIASSQEKETKQQLKLIFLLMLLAQIFLGFLNWTPAIGKISGFSLAIAYPISLLWTFFAISLIQILLIIMNTKLNILIVVLNFINSILIFISLNLTSRILGFQAFSVPAVAGVFLVLFGNIVGLVFINKDKNLLRKYFK